MTQRRQYRMPRNLGQGSGAGAGKGDAYAVREQMVDVGKGNPTDVPARDPSLERQVRRMNFKNWYPFYHWREFYGTVDGKTPGQQLVAALAAEGNLLRYFVNVPADLHLCNLRQDGMVPFPFDAYGCGLAIKGDEVFYQQADPIVGVSFRQLLTEHTRFEFKMRDATTLVNHYSGLIMPGMGVSGSIATTSNNADRMQDVSGFPHPSAFYRFGGPDRGEVEQLDKGDLVEGTLHFDNVAMATLQAWFPAEAEQTPKLSLSIGMFLYGWTHRKVF